MMSWPATPNKTEAPNASSTPATFSASARVAVPDLAHLDRRTGSATKGKHFSNAAEPSPASTYGGTAVGDSEPSTPLDGDTSANLGSDIYRGLRRMQIEGHKINPVEVSYAKNAEILSPSRQELGFGPASPIELAVAEIVELPVMTSPIAGTRKPALVSPGDGRRNLQGQSNSRSVSFVLPPTGSDPFFEDANASAGQILAAGSNSDDVKVSDASSNNSSSPGSPSQSTTGEVVTPSCSGGSSFRPREDRGIVEISGDNAQAVYPPNACVFVANLVQSLADDQLEFSVSRAFEQFGKVYVKIKRDPRGMPYAFCQYEDVTNSERAIQHGRGLMVDGRQCRTERAKVNRSLYLSRVTGGPISEAEARHILTGRGDLEKLWHPSPTDREMFRLQDGIWVMFAFFQDCRDAQALFKDSSRYRLEQPPLPDDIHARLGRSTPSSAARAGSSGRNYMSPPTYQTRHSERFTLWVGNLPQDVTQAAVRAMFQSYGNIRSIEVVSRPFKTGHGMTVFAYVEFANEDDARRAASQTHVLNGSRVRVEMKETSEQATLRNMGNCSSGSPHPRRAAGNNPGWPNGWPRHVPMSAQMHRAITLGVAPTDVWNIFNPDLAMPAENRDVSNQIAVAPPAYSQIPYQHSNYFPHPYTTYGAMPSGTDGDQGNNPVYATSTPLYPAMANAQWNYPAGPYYTGYSTAPSYAYPVRSGDMSANEPVSGEGASPTH